MLKIHCAGCGVSEEAGREDKVKPRALVTRIPNKRSFDVEEEHTEDLCDTCFGIILHNFFGIKREVRPDEVPARLQLVAHG